MDNEVLKTLADAFLTISSCFNKLLASDHAIKSSSPSASDSTPTPAAPLSEAPKGEEAEKVLSFEEVRSILVKRARKAIHSLSKSTFHHLEQLSFLMLKKRTTTHF